jgi:phospholipid/cholesterol/gamma-HCH transport system permease protein
VPPASLSAPAALGGTADPAATTLAVDTRQLAAWDADLAPALWALLAPLAQRGVRLRLDGLADDVRAALKLALPDDSDDGDDGSAIPATDTTPLPRRASRGAWADVVTTVGFVGELLLAGLRLLRGRSAMRASDLLHQMDETGPRSLPIVALTTFLVGLLLAYMGGAQLGRIGAQMFIADLVTVGVVRELAGLMTGVILAGRVGAAFAAQLGTMQANEEIDALRTLGVNPIEYLVLPRLLGMLLVAPLLVAMAMLVGVLAGLPAAVAIYDVPVPLYLQKCLESLTWTHLWIGLFKGTMYTLLVVVAGCREGLHAGRNAQAVGEATTRAVVKALVWIVLAACASTVVLQSLGF